MIISVASGKGGTGKTLFSTALALAVDDYSFIDCDVEAPNAHIFLKPTINEEIEVNQFTPKIDVDRCTLCGLCVKHCEHNALGLFGEEIKFFPELCHGCPTCQLVCPEDAIVEKSKDVGSIKKGTINTDSFISGTLNTGEVQSTTIIDELKEQAENGKFTIIDCPPCTGHPLIRAVNKSDYAFLVTEPTPFGLNDLKKAIGVMDVMEIPYSVVINRDGIGTDEVEEFCIDSAIDVAMKIPFKEEIAKAYSKGEPLYSVLPEMREDFFNLIKRIENRL